MWKQCALHSPVTPPLDPCTAHPRSRFPTSRPPSRHSAFCRARRLGLSAVMQDPIIKYAIFISPAYAFFHYITEQILIYWNNIFFFIKKKITCGNRVLRRIALLDRILNLITKYSSNLFYPLKILWTYMVNLNFTFFFKRITYNIEEYLQWKRSNKNKSSWKTWAIETEFSVCNLQVAFCLIYFFT